MLAWSVGFHETAPAAAELSARFSAGHGKHNHDHPDNELIDHWNRAFIPEYPEGDNEPDAEHHIGFSQNPSNFPKSDIAKVAATGPTMRSLIRPVPL